MYSPSLDRLATTSDVSTALGTFMLAYNMQTSVTGWIPIGTISLTAGVTVANLNWTGLERDSHYEWYASASDGINISPSETRRFSTISPTRPTLSLTRPFNRAVFVTPSSVPLAVNVSGAVNRVEYFSDNTKIGVATAPPYEFTWAGPPQGSHRLTALAFDLSGDATLSNVVNVSVSALGSSDADGDSIPDEYEIAHGLNRFDPEDAELDSDGDGNRNLTEFIFGTAADVSDRYELSTVHEIGSSTNTIRFSTKPGRSYRVMYGDTLRSWQPASEVITGTGETVLWKDAGEKTGSLPSLTSKRFYRIEVTVTP